MIFFCLTFLFKKLKKAYFLVLLLSFTNLLYAQENKRVSLGINAGINHSIILGRLNQDVANFGLTTFDKIGFNLGILADIKLKKRFYINPRAEVHFNNSSFQFYNSFSIYEQKIRPISLEFKSYFTFLRSTAPTSSYFFLGPNYRVTINKNISPSTSPVISDLTLDLGFGLKNKLDHFTISPEIRYSFGFKNISIHPSMDYIRLHSIHLVFNLSE